MEHITFELDWGNTHGVLRLTCIDQFLMRYYSPGDDIYFFGFSRGAYTARFLAEMLDHVGLLSVSVRTTLYSGK
jgi:uncharacterized protein (DUF2235 family)